jgi:glycosyltransferase involved in cell wall biosynthesis
VRETANVFSTTIVISCRNERGNIEAAVQRIPPFGGHQEIIFVDGHSTDGTIEEIERVMEAYPDRNIRLLVQDGTGKSDAVRKGFALATGDILMILDADLTMPAEDLPKFYDAIASGKGEFINGCRLVYPMEVAGDAGAESPGEQVLQHGFLLVAEPADQRHALWDKSLISS